MVWAAHRYLPEVTLVDKTVAQTTASATIGFRVRAITRDGAIIQVNNGATLHTGDRLWFEVQTSVAMHLYIVQVFADGSAALLYPQKADLKTRRDKITRVPVGEFDYFQLDAMTGIERILLIATRRSLPQADQNLATLISKIKGEGRWPEPAHPELSADPAGRTTGSAARAKPTSQAPLGYLEPSVHTRGLKLHSDASELRLAADPQGVAVSIFELNHLP